MAIASITKDEACELTPLVINLDYNASSKVFWSRDSIHTVPISCRFHVYLMFFSQPGPAGDPFNLFSILDH